MTQNPKGYDLFKSALTKTYKREDFIVKNEVLNHSVILNLKNLNT